MLAQKHQLGCLFVCHHLEVVSHSFAPESVPCRLTWSRPHLARCKPWLGGGQDVAVGATNWWKIGAESVPQQSLAVHQFCHPMEVFQPPPLSHSFNGSVATAGLCHGSQCHSKASHNWTKSVFVQCQCGIMGLLLSNFPLLQQRSTATVGSLPWHTQMCQCPFWQGLTQHGPMCLVDANNCLSPLPALLDKECQPQTQTGLCHGVDVDTIQRAHMTGPNQCPVNAIVASGSCGAIAHSFTSRSVAMTGLCHGTSHSLMPFLAGSHTKMTKCASGQHQ